MMGRRQINIREKQILPLNKKKKEKEMLKTLKVIGSVSITSLSTGMHSMKVCVPFCLDSQQVSMNTTLLPTDENISIND